MTKYDICTTIYIMLYFRLLAKTQCYNKNGHMQDHTSVDWFNGTVAFPVAIVTNETLFICSQY